MQNGAVVCRSDIVNHYVANSIVADDDAVLLLHRHRNRDPYLEFTPAIMPQLQNPPRFLLAEFTAGVLADGPNGEPALLFVLAPNRPSQQNATWEVGVLVGTQLVQCESFKSRISFNGIDLHQDNTFRIAMDTQTGNAVLWCNGKLLQAGSISRGVGRKSPFSYIGDGASKAVNGIVRFKGAVVGVPQ